MPDWKDLNIKAIGKEAEAKTDDKLASRVSSLTKFNDEQIKQLFPEKGDVAKLAELMQIVKSADSQNAKINQIFQNAEKFGKILITLLSKGI